MLLQGFGMGSISQGAIPVKATSASGTKVCKQKYSTMCLQSGRFRLQVSSKEPIRTENRAKD